jgi:hypothetical protein
MWHLKTPDRLSKNQNLITRLRRASRACRYRAFQLPITRCLEGFRLNTVASRPRAAPAKTTLEKYEVEASSPYL